MRIALIVLIVLIVGAQFIPVTRHNPLVRADFNDNSDVRQVLRKSCYDCHSNESVWPWYSYVAPVSWLVASDVNEAREKLNFSDWGQMSPDKQARVREGVWEEVNKGEMPLSQYLLMHSEAKLTEADKTVIRDWATGVVEQTAEPMEEAGE